MLSLCTFVARRPATGHWLLNKRYDSSEAQSGKDICDRKIASMNFINEGDAGLNAQDRHRPPFGSVKECFVPLVHLNAKGMSEKVHWSSITTFKNSVFWAKYVTGWKAYNVVLKKYPLAGFHKGKDSQETTSVTGRQYLQSGIDTGHLR